MHLNLRTEESRAILNQKIAEKQRLVDRLTVLGYKPRGISEKTDAEHAAKLKRSHEAMERALENPALVLSHNESWVKKNKTVVIRLRTSAHLMAGYFPDKRHKRAHAQSVEQSVDEIIAVVR